MSKYPWDNEWDVFAYLHKRILECKKSLNPFARRNVAIYETTFITLLLNRIHAYRPSEPLAEPYANVLIHYLQGNHDEVEKVIQEEIKELEKCRRT
jgi:hypothetical protein